MFMRTPQPGLWFIAGSFAHCRIYSKYLALQIKASEEAFCPRPSLEPPSTTYSTRSYSPLPVW